LTLCISNVYKTLLVHVGRELFLYMLHPPPPPNIKEIKNLKGGRVQKLKLRGGGGGAHSKNLRRAEGGAENFGIFRVKNHNWRVENWRIIQFRHWLYVFQTYTKLYWSTLGENYFFTGIEPRTYLTRFVKFYIMKWIERLKKNYFYQTILHIL
jgi:hypothetical protein